MESAACIVIYTDDGRYLLQKRDDFAPYFPNCWGLIGGSAKNGENPAECIRRECFEETHWSPKDVEFLFLQEEHCIEYIYSAELTVPPLELICEEGEKLCLFSYEEAAEINWSSYHKRIFEQVHSILLCKSHTKNKSVLLYTKVLPPAIGGYVTAGKNFIDAFKGICDLTVVSDSFDSSGKKEDNVDYITFEDCLQYSPGHFDLLFFNATYEQTDKYNVLRKLCRTTWDFEHNQLTEAYKNEMISRFDDVKRIIVPSAFLRDSIYEDVKSSYNIDVIPIPINQEKFYFSSGEAGEIWKIVSVCMIKKVRRIESLIEVASFIKRKGIKFSWDIIGDIPFQGNLRYFAALKNKISDAGLSDVFHFIGMARLESIGLSLHNYDVFVDFSLHETYGQAKLEAIFSGLGILMPDIENNSHLLPQLDRLLSSNLPEFCQQVYDKLIQWTEKPTEYNKEKYENWHYANHNYGMTAIRIQLIKLLYEEI